MSDFFEVLSLRIGGLFVCLLILSMSWGCVPLDKVEVKGPLAELGSPHDTVNTARVSLFLNLKDPADSPGIQFELSDLEVLADQVWLPVNSGPLQLDSEKIASTQLFLGGRPVPPGRYERFRFTVTKGAYRLGNGDYQIASVDPYSVELALARPLMIAEDDSVSLFVTWDARESLERSDTLYPVMSLAPPMRQLFGNLVYAACPDIDTIFVIRNDKNWVADSFGVRGHPTYIANDPDPSARLLYILASSEKRIKAVELSSQRVIDSFSIPLVQEASFMTISPDGKWAYILDTRESYLNRLDLETGRLLARVRLEFEPQYASYLGSRDTVAVSSVISQTVSFRDPLDLSEVNSVVTGSSPDGLLFSNNLLYITESGANTVSIFDFSANTITGRMNVGFSPRRLLDNGNQIYVSNYDSGSLSVIFPGQLEVSREVLGLGRPLEMVYDSTYRLIYVGDAQEAGLAIIDSTINELKGYVRLGAPPQGLVFIRR